jgi:2'-5' RNA ligase
VVEGPQARVNLFIALPLSGELRAELGALARPGVPARWARPEGLHLTLAFLGPGPEASEVAPLLADCAAAHGRFRLQTSALGGFPSLRKARVLWLGVEEEPRLRRLAADLRRRLQEAGVPFDAKPFAPHITLARLKAPSDLEGLASPPPRPFPADRLALYRSHRLPDAAHYEVIAEAPLMASSSSEPPP